MDQQSPLVSRMSKLFAQGASAYCAAAAMAGVIGVGLCVAIIFVLNLQISAEPFDPLTIWRSLTAGQKIALILALLLEIWLPVFVGARGVCRITFDLLAGRKPSAPKVLFDMLRFIPAAIIYSLLCGLPVMIGSAFLYVPALLVASLFTLVVPTGINEHLKGLQALKRGFSLSGKVYGKLLLTVVVSVVLFGVGFVARGLLLDSFITGSHIRVIVIRTSLVCVPGLLLLALANICFTLLYLEARAAEANSSPQTPAGAASGS